MTEGTNRPGQKDPQHRGDTVPDARRPSAADPAVSSAGTDSGSTSAQLTALSGAAQASPSDQPAVAQVAPADAAAGAQSEPHEDAWAEYDEQGADLWQAASREADAATTRQATGEYRLPGLTSEQPAAAAPVAAPVVRGQLVGIAGADKGLEFLLGERDLTVGRAGHNQIILREPSVSREHARLFFDDDRFVLVDNRSANGTFVNGERVDRARLRSGDEIAFGTGTYRFVESSGVLAATADRAKTGQPGGGTGQKEVAGQRWRAWPWALVAVVAVGLVVALAVVVWGRWGPHEGDRREMVFRYYMEGVQAYKERQWGQAESRFQVVLTLEPDHAFSQRYIQAIAREQTAAKLLALAQQEQRSGDSAAAYRRLAELADTSYRAEALALTEAIETELEARLSQARQAMQAGNNSEAMQLIQAVEAVRADWPGLTELKVLAQRAAAGSPRGRGSDAAPAKPDSDGTTPNSTPVSDSRADKRPAGVVAAPVRQAFAAADMPGALAALDKLGRSDEALELRRQIERFAAVYADAAAEHRAKRAAGAITLLEDARVLALDIGRERGALLQEIERKIADMNYVQGIQYFLKKDYPGAFRAFSAAVAHDRQHSPSLRKLEEIQREAEALYETATRDDGKSDVAAARRDLQLVLQLTAPGSELYRKAEQRLQGLP